MHDEPEELSYINFEDPLSWIVMYVELFLNLISLNQIRHI